MASSTAELQHPNIVTHAEWLAARKDFLAKEKEFTRLRDDLSRQRRELPWESVGKPYVFDGPDGKETLADLFGGRSQMIIYHFMFGPGWKEGCRSCSFMADHFDALTIHLAHRDVMLAVVSRAPIEAIEAFKKRMGWRFKWASSFGSDFNFDYQASFTREEVATGKIAYNYSLQPFPSEETPGASVFAKDGSGQVFHTYSSYARGLDILVGVYNFLDLVPKGRDEQGFAWPQAWVRYHDKYAEDYKVDPAQSYAHPELDEGSCCSGKTPAP